MCWLDGLACHHLSALLARRLEERREMCILTLVDLVKMQIKTTDYNGPVPPIRQPTATSHTELQQATEHGQLNSFWVISVLFSQKISRCRASRGRIQKGAGCSVTTHIATCA